MHVSLGVGVHPHSTPTCVNVGQRSSVQAVWLTPHVSHYFQENNSFYLVFSKGQEISLNGRCQAPLSAAGTVIVTRLSICSSTSPGSSFFW